MPGQLTLQEREIVAQMQYAKKSPAEIAWRLGRHRCTISRELARNGNPQGYSAVAAQTRCRERRRQRPWVKKMDRAELGERVRAELAKCWSPDQIAGRARHDAPRDKRAWISHQTIYTWVQSHPQREFWQQFLRRGGRRRPPNDRRGQIPGSVSIEGRPAVVDRRNRFGDWEGDTMHGRGSSASLLTLVERKSGYLSLSQVKDRKAASITRAAKRKLGPLSAELRKTATFDNGKEFAEHEKLARAMGVNVYYARPYCAWQRGTNENTNGLIRQFFPKGANLSQYSHQEVARAETLINERPRKRLGYKSPHEVLAAKFPVAFEV